MKSSIKKINELKNKCNEIDIDKQTVKERIANNLHELRRKKKLSQEDVAEILEISRTSVGRHEQFSSPDIPSILHLLKYAKLYDSTLDYIAGSQKS